MIIRNGLGYRNELEAIIAFLQEKTRLIVFRFGQDNETLLHYAASTAHDEACEIIIKRGWLIGEINKPAGPDGRTPLLESVRWNRHKLFDLLRNHGADLHAMARNPYDDAVSNWSALHIFSDQAHENDLSMVDTLLGAGLPIDGPQGIDVETPFNIAVRRSAFKLANYLLQRGASINATSMRSAFLICTHALTGLGHLIALNSRHAKKMVQYLAVANARLQQSETGFIVDPCRGFTALHLCAIVPHGISYISGGALSVAEFGWETSWAICHELLEWAKDTDQLNTRCEVHGKTALHYAAEYGNVGVAKELTDAGIDRSILCNGGQTAAEIARAKWSKHAKLLHDLLPYI
jgi:ankyrin repeat protein